MQRKTGPEQKLDYRFIDSFKLTPMILSFSSGKGGVGKTLSAINFAATSAQLGIKTLILDGDMGMANVDVVLGLEARYNVRDVLDGDISLRDVILEGPLGIKVIPSGSGIAQLVNLSFFQKQVLIEKIKALTDEFDLVIIDTSAGIGDNVVHLNQLAHRRIVVTTPEPHAITDAYALIKVLREKTTIKTFDLIVNMVPTPEEGEAVARRIAGVAQRYVNAEVNYLGSVPRDPAVTKAVLRRQAASAKSLQTISGQAWAKIARSCITHLTQTSHHLDWHDMNQR